MSVTMTTTAVIHGADVPQPPQHGRPGGVMRRLNFGTGLIGGIGLAQPMLAMALMALVLLAVYVGDHPAVSRRTRRQDLLLDRAHTDHTSLRAHVERVLGCEVVDLAVRRTDLVNDTTLVSVTTVDAPAAKAPRVTSVEVTR